MSTIGPRPTIGQIVLVTFRDDEWPAIIVSTPDMNFQDSCLVEIFGLDGHDRKQIVHHREGGGDLTWRWPDHVLPTPDNVRELGSRR